MWRELVRWVKAVALVGAIGYVAYFGAAMIDSVVGR